MLAERITCKKDLLSLRIIARRLKPTTGLRWRPQNWRWLNSLAFTLSTCKRRKRVPRNMFPCFTRLSKNTTEKHPLLSSVFSKAHGLICYIYWFYYITAFFPPSQHKASFGLWSHRKSLCGSDSALRTYKMTWIYTKKTNRALNPVFTSKDIKKEKF